MTETADQEPLEPLRGRVSVARLERQWFIACTSSQLSERPMQRQLQGTRVVLFRVKGAPVALLDRCPHRNVLLSTGRRRGDTLECRYHGWRFDAGGKCTTIPGLCSDPELRSRNVPAFATREVDGFVWVYSTPDTTPTTGPYRFPYLDDARYAHARRMFRVPATMHAVLENTLDVPHTRFLHGGLFRTEKKANDIEVVVRRTAEQAEAEYLGEPRPEGLAGRILAPGGGTVQHFDRFILPCVAQVEYRLGERSHLVTTSAHTPIGDFDTAIYVVVSFRLPLPGWLVRPFVTPVATHIFGQDASILREQTDNIRRFAGERYATTEIDVLGPHIWRMLRHAARGEAVPGGPTESRVRMRA